MNLEAKEIIVDAKMYYNMMYKLFMIGETLIDEYENHITKDMTIEKIRKIMRGEL